MKKDKSTSPLGFEPEETERCVELLNELLCNLQVHYQKLKNFHWNVEGGDFYDLHEQFQQGYQAVEGQIDEIAERIRILGLRPMSRMSDYLKHSNIEEAGADLSATEMVKEIINDYEILLSYMIEAIEHADATADLSTSLLITEFMRQTEKSHWRLTSFSKK